MSFYMWFEGQGPHPEGVYQKLTTWDDEVWDLSVYGKCLDDWDILNDCLELASKEYANDYANEKFKLRLGGLQIIRDVDNCG